MNEDCELRLQPCHITALRRHLQSSMGTQPLAPAVKLAQWWQRGSVTWDITLSRPIQHCEEHNRQGWPFTHALLLPLCWTTACASPCRATGQHNALYRGLARDWWFRLHGSLLFDVNTVLHFMNVNVMFVEETTLSQRVINSPSVWAQLIISQTDGYKVELQQEMCHPSVLMTERVYLMTISHWLTALLGGLQPHS